MLFQKLRGWLRAEGWCRGELMAAGISGREQGRRRDEMAKLDRAATGIARWWRGWSKSHRGLGLGVPASAGLLEVTEAEEEEPERGVREQHESHGAGVAQGVVDGERRVEGQGAQAQLCQRGISSVVQVNSNDLPRAERGTKRAQELIYGCW